MKTWRITRNDMRSFNESNKGFGNKRRGKDRNHTCKMLTSRSLKPTFNRSEQKKLQSRLKKKPKNLKKSKLASNESSGTRTWSRKSTSRKLMIRNGLKSSLLKIRHTNQLNSRFLDLKVRNRH